VEVATKPLLLQWPPGAAAKGHKDTLATVKPALLYLKTQCCFLACSRTSQQHVGYTSQSLHKQPFLSTIILVYHNLNTMDSSDNPWPSRQAHATRNTQPKHSLHTASLGRFRSHVHLYTCPHTACLLHLYQTYLLNTFAKHCLHTFAKHQHPVTCHKHELNPMVQF
jgi:hypothetical protein